MLAVPVLVGVNVEVQVAEAAVPESVQVVKLPVTPVTVIATVPVGVRKVPAADVSVTVTVQVEPVLTVTGLGQLIVVVVVRGLTVMLAVPLLAVWVVSPG